MLAAAASLAVPLAACQPAGSASVTLDRSPAGLEQLPLTITTAARRTHKFVVEVARSPAEQQRGLMFREVLAPDRGMIFPYSPPESVAFWMKNTMIPLDMVFIRTNGTIARIEANAVPLSEEPVPAGEPVAAVLELAGGRAAELGIAAGDTVAW